MARDRQSIGVPLELGGNTDFWEEHDILGPLKAGLADIGAGNYSASNQGIDLSKDLTKEEANQLLTDSSFIQDIYDFYYERRTNFF